MNHVRAMPEPCGQFTMTEQDERDTRLQLAETDKASLIDAMIFQMEVCNGFRNQLVDAENTIANLVEQIQHMKGNNR